MICAVVGCPGFPIVATDGTVLSSGAPRPRRGDEGEIVERLCFHHLTRRPVAAFFTDTDTAVALTRAHFEEGIGSMNLKENTKAGICEAMRCKDTATCSVAPEAHEWPNRGTVHLCQKHYGNALADGNVPPGGGAAITTAPSSSSSPDTSYTVEIETWKGEALGIVESLDGFEITTQEEFELASEALAEIKGLAKKVQAKKEEITKPMRAAEKAARELFKPTEAVLDKAETAIKSMIGKFAADEQRRNDEAAAAAALAAEAGDADAAAAALARIGTAKNVEGLTVSEVWTFEITDPDKVPRHLCTPDESKIRAYVKMHGGSAPNPVEGIVFAKTQRVASRSS